jgi:predicted adenine nucleotide alpha hydrolase (AANH) superfamily ATPase
MKDNVNFNSLTEAVIHEIRESKKRKSLLLHVCCAPCSSYVLEYLNEYFDITVYFYNPNIDIESEYRYRAEEEKRLLGEMPMKNPVKYVQGEYDVEKFIEMSRGLEDAPEGGARCIKCYELRLERAAKYAKDMGFDLFTTTLSISPLKNSRVLNLIGERLSQKYGVDYLYSDFKKKNGYKRSVELSAEYKLYRQSFCGCSYSKRQSENK